MISLDQLLPGQAAQVLGIRQRGPIGQRLGEMGLVEGTRVRMIRYAPFGDPLEIEVQDYLLSLRRSEAAMVDIQLA
jgi:ferrous iron transport protein A